MAHLGVLKALEQSGIVVDMIAGTSAGAMTGVFFASGYGPGLQREPVRCGPASLVDFSHFAAGRPMVSPVQVTAAGQFDPMLRKYLLDWKLEQLAVPCLSVTVDLVSGKPVVRDAGDAVHAILESINLPVLAVPIVRNGQALIDGGLVNNIPRGRAGVEWVQLCDRRQRDSEDGDGVLRYHLGGRRCRLPPNRAS